MVTKITDATFDPWQEIIQYQQDAGFSGQFGATATFVGTMRERNAHIRVSSMTLEHYPAMTAQYLARLETQARQRWGLLDSLIIHRVGHISPADPIVLIACWSAHRRAALDACAWLIEELKYNAPFWKKEVRTDGEHWIEHNTDGTEQNN